MTRPRHRPLAAGVVPGARARPPREGPVAPAHVGWIIGALSLLVLGIACRGAPLGAPAADDYDYLYGLRFQHPLDPWGAMGSDWYWRPLSRQLYFLVTGGALFTAPWLVAALHATLLALLFTLVYRTARRALDPWTAAAIAAFPILALPTRALLAWPTGAQPLLGMVGIALAVHEAAARRTTSALVALAAALLSHVQAVLALPLVPVVYAIAVRDRARALRFGGFVTAVAAALVAGSLVAARHGAGLPPRVPIAEAWAAAPGMLRHSLAIQLGLDEHPPLAQLVTRLLAGALGLVTVAALVRRPARARLAERAPALVTGAAWFVVGIALLTFTPALFTPRHTCVPSLGLGLALGLVLGAASPRLAAVSIAVRALVLLLALPAPTTMAADVPGGSSKMSFLEIVRLQRTAESARRALQAAYPRLPHGATVRYWSLPRASEVAFAKARAVRVWYGDSTLAWTFWDRSATPPEDDPAPTLAFDLSREDPAVVMRPRAMRRYEDAMAALGQGDLRAAETAFVEAEAAQTPPVHNFSAEITRLVARLALERGDDVAAASWNERDRGLEGDGASYHELQAVLAWRGGRREEAGDEAARCLALRPDDRHAQAILDSLRWGLGPSTALPARAAARSSPTAR